jgi:hypothetical protein
MSDKTSYPLCWPAGWPRTQSRRAKELHPDCGGTNEQMAELNLAYAEARKMSE